ncbi:two-component system regulatory protein YycI [Bacillus sp. REN16]|uniref:two-component system regulatory protein YycI n=1 Tax=Bacillus sp. REN16 TaxID=2887296 RepID=UPI001E5D1A5D|nr:two-component system regulatory protein YycI [Bacillus sp. REN16]MCC3359002.1 two-component system regulatory protein YycI [Bacillus sp. REN16]
MDWSKTQSLFIIVFLILNVFLGYQLAQKRDSSQIDALAELTTDEELANEEIKYEALPKEPKELSYISGKVQIFTEDDVKNLKNQEVTIETAGVLKGEFKDPIKVSLTDQLKIQQFVKDHLLSGEKYSVWSIDEEAGIIVLVQQHKNYKVFGISGVIYLYVNDDHEAISYEQTLIPEFKEHEPEELITPLATLGNLLDNNHLKSGSHVSKVEIGYYPLLPYSESQLLAPAWHVVIDDEKEIYVNAIEGQILNKTE